MVLDPHVLIALGDCAGGRHVPVFPIHVVGPTVGVLVQPDTKVLHPKVKRLPVVCVWHPGF